MNPSEEYVPMKEPKYCFVPTCKNKNNSHKDKNTMFFVVPSSAKYEWCKSLGVGCPKRALYICEAHLNLKEDVENYLYWTTMKARPKLRATLPASLVQHTSGPEPSTSSSLSFPMKMDKGTDYKNPNICNKAIQVKPKTADRTTYCCISSHKIISEIIPDEEALPSTQGSTTTVTSADMSEPSEMFEVDKHKTTNKSFMLDLIACRPQDYIGLTKTYYWVISFLESKLEGVKANDIIITLYKIKNNVPFNQISDMFGISLTTLWRLFYKTLCALAKFFNQLIFCPTLLTVKRNLPSCFRTNKEYTNIFCIIDCFEIEIEKPADPINQSLTWSQYKNANTLKYLVATTPDGFINFVSAGFGGRISDIRLVEVSGFLDVLQSGCTVLADRGFKHIESILSTKNIKLLRPPSVTKDGKLTKQEAIKSKVIASLRIHVERVIRRIRLFKMLKPHAVINNKLIQHTDEIVIIACGLINLQNSIINNE